MAKRFIIVVGALIFVIGLLAFLKMQQFKAMGAMMKGPPPEAVTTLTLQKQSWPQSLSSVGSLAAVQGVTVSADLPGVVERIGFESGSAVKAGDLLVQINVQQEQAQLRSAEARREMMQVSLTRAEDLLKTQTNSQSQLDSAKMDFRQADASVAEVKAMIERKTIRAPFDGVVGIRQVNVGQYVNSGAPIVSLQSLDPIYVNFAVPQLNLAKLKVGTPVKIRTDATGGTEFDGTINAINSVVDEATRNISVQATIQNPGNRLRPGMFASVQVILPQIDDLVSAPASAIAYAPYGNSVFVVEEKPGADGKPAKTVRQQFVKLGPSRGDLVAIVEGVKAGEEVVSSGVFKLRNGAGVLVNNSVQPGAEQKPKPADT
ncbi:MAG: efflux RND transporter periplasmic adaptor subunit [Verrucomicrobia bacterium]|nr:efflux RND transporter periplasmic adaptor subunit [Verrucomicrobiota bacterium]